MIKLLVITLVFQLIISCKKSNNSVESAPPSSSPLSVTKDKEVPSEANNYDYPEFNITAKSPEEALAMLASDDLAHFTRWKNKLVKTCSAADLFNPEENEDTTQANLDLDQFVKIHGKNLILTSENYALKWDYFIAPVGTSESRFRKSISVNSKSYIVEAKIVQENGFCNVWLYNQQVYKFQAASSMPVSMLITKEIPEQNETNIFGIPKTLVFSNQPEKIVVGHEFGPLIVKAMKPTPEAFTILAKEFNLSNNMTKKLFPLTEPSELDDISSQIISPLKSLTFSPKAPTLVGESEDISKIFQATPTAGVIKVATKFNELIKDEKLGRFILKKNSDKVLEYNFNFQITPRKNKEDYQYTFSNNDIKGVRGFIKNEGAKCFNDIILKYLSLISDDPLKYNHIYFYDIYNTCSPLTSDLASDLRETKFIYKLLPQILNLVTPTVQTVYNSWDWVFINEILHLYNQEKDIAHYFDKNNSWVLFEKAAENLEKINLNFKKSLHINEKIKEELNKKAVSWALSGQAIDQSYADEIVQGIDKNLPHFEESVKSLITSLNRNMNYPKNTITFANSIDLNYQKSVLETKELVQKFNDPENWLNIVFNKILQKEIPITDITNLKNLLISIDSEISIYPNLSQCNYKGDIASIFLKAYRRGENTEGFKKSIFLAFNTLSSRKEFSYQANKLISNLQDTISNGQDTITYVNNLVSLPEYQNVIFEIKDLSLEVKALRWSENFVEYVFKNKPTLEELKKWKNSILSLKTFLEKDNSLNSSSFFDNPTDLLEKAIRQNWGDREFNLLRPIVLLGKYKSGCNYKESSIEIINCIGLKLIGNNQNEYFNISYEDRYATLATSFLNYLNILQPEHDFYNTRQNLLSFFDTWKLLWGQCDKNSFNQKNQKTKEKVSELIKVNNSSNMLEKFRIRDEIQDLLNDC